MLRCGNAERRPSLGLWEMKVIHLMPLATDPQQFANGIRTFLRIGKLRKSVFVPQHFSRALLQILEERLWNVALEKPVRPIFAILRANSVAA